MPHHTPGPWKQASRGPNNCPLVGSATGVLVAMLSTGIDFEEQAEANARLISAAPTLLDALKKIERLCNEGTDDVRDLMSISNLARVAIAEAQ